LLCQHFDQEFHLENPASNTDEQKPEEIWEICAVFVKLRKLFKEKLSKIYWEVEQNSFFIFSKLF